MARLVFLLHLLLLYFFCYQLLAEAKVNFEKKSVELNPAIVRHSINTVSNNVLLTATVLEIDLSSKNISIKVGLPGQENLKVKDYLSNIVKNTMAYVGINANFFDVVIGNPLGTLISDKEWLVGPVYNRAAIGFSDDKKILIGRVMLQGNVSVYRGFLNKALFGKFNIDGLNIPYHLYKEVGLYTTNWDEILVVPENKIAVAVSNGCIERKKITSIEIPHNGYVLVSDANSVLELLKDGDCLEIQWQTNPNWSSVVEAISGGPYLIMNGQIFIDVVDERFNFSAKDVHAPRSAIGVGKNEKLYLIAASGTKNGKSIGLTLEQLAKFLKNLDLKEAINLDGGRSTTLVIGDKVVNELQDKHERKISNGLLIFYDN